MYCPSEMLIGVICQVGNEENAFTYLGSISLIPGIFYRYDSTLAIWQYLTQWNSLEWCYMKACLQKLTYFRLFSCWSRFSFLSLSLCVSVCFKFHFKILFSFNVLYFSLSLSPYTFYYPYTFFDFLPLLLIKILGIFSAAKRQ